MVINDELIEKIDQFIRHGEYASAKKLLDSVAITKTPERLVVKLSDLLIRAGMFKHNTKLLYPLMYNQNQAPVPKVIARYALTMQQIGAYHEATRIFEKFDFTKAPEANFYYAINLFAKFEYEEAIQYLETYINNPELNAYEKMVGRVNLIQAYLGASQYDLGEELLNQIEAEIEKPQLTLLRANFYQLKAQLLYSRNEYQNAIKFLASSESILKTFTSHYQLTVRFWQVICELALQPKTPSAIKAFSDLRKKAVQLGRWAIVRQCDFHRSVIEQNDELFLKVYFGTPFSAYRKRLESLFGHKVSIPDQYLWNPTEKKISPSQVIDVSEGIDMHSHKKLKRGQVTHRTLRTLCSDFYINFKLETVASYLFPDEHYNPVTSYKRAFTAVSKLQRWFRDYNIPIEVRLKDEGYRLFFVEPYALKVQMTYEDELEFDPKADLLQTLAKDQLYSAKELSVALKIPLRTTYRKLAELVNNDVLTREKYGNEVKYRLTLRKTMPKN